MASRDKKDLEPSLVSAYMVACDAYKEKYPSAPQPLISCTYRSNDEQTMLYNQGRTTPGKIVTNAKAGQSKHNVYPSKAFDIAFIDINKKLDWSEILFKEFADIIKENPLVEWGGDFP